MDLESVVEGFVKTLCSMKSRTYPYRATRVDRLWVLRDDLPRRKERKIEVVSLGATPEETVALVQHNVPGWHFIVAVVTPDQDGANVRAKYKSLGYRALSTEWIFLHDRAEIPQFQSEPPVRFVESAERLDQVKQVASQPRKMMEGSRLYGIWDDHRDYGWVRGLSESGCGWAYALHVHEPFRRRGYGRALMSKLLSDDRAAGLAASCLIASTAGARLYPHLGYREIAAIQIFSPVSGKG